MSGALRGRSVWALALVALLLVTALPIQTVSANPYVPYCPGSAHDAGVTQPELCETLTGRVFPEAMDATDYVSFFEFEAGMDHLLANHPGWAEMFSVGESFGLLDPVTGDRVKFPVYVIEITNSESPIPVDERIDLLYMLSIHGNEKGAREAGFRIFEDFMKGIGVAAETVQNGAGMPDPIEKPTGGSVETYLDYLDFMRLVFILPNPDGWVHDDSPYFLEPYCLTFFCRTNGNGTDLNRQAPSIGWQRVNVDAGRLTLNEPEAQSYVPYLRDNYEFAYATDIHGMLNHENFVAIMMPAAQLNPLEEARSVRIAENLKQNLNADSYFDLWRDVLGGTVDTTVDAAGEAQHTLEPATDALCEVDDEVCLSHTGIPKPASGVFAEWMSVWDAIGYTDSGFTGDWFSQRHGLNAPAYDIELAYNHMVFDSQYVPGGQAMNDLHVRSVRHIVKNFMDQAALDVQISLETFGSSTLYLPTSTAVTNLALEEKTPGGVMERNPHTKDLVYTADVPYLASSADYFREMRPFVRDGERLGVLERAQPDRLDAALLDRFDNLVIGGSAIRDIEADAGAIEAILQWVERGGNLILTDESLRFFDLAGLTSSGVDDTVGYVGALNIDYDHPLATDVRTIARQTYEPVPIGFSIETNSAPMWGIERAAWSGLGGDEVGTLYNSDHVGLGIVPQGAGQIHFIGALLPDPSQEFYHPFGLDSYATIPTGNTLLRNMLGWELRFTTPPVIITDEGKVVRTDAHSFYDEEELEAIDEVTQAPAPIAALLIGLVLLSLAVFRRRGL